MTSLRVLADGQWMGSLAVADNRWSFDYAPAWRAYALSPNFPLAQRRHQDSDGRRQVEWFFDNLLPEGRLRELIAARDRVDPRDIWALLARHGRDTAGALSLIADDTAKPADGTLLPLDREALQARIEASQQRNLPLMASWDRIRMSLPGAQEKLGVHIAADGAMFLPEGTAASTHIVKPENASADFPFCPANEFFCLRLAAEQQLRVPAVDLLHLPAPLYIIERFDRRRIADAAGSPGRVHRLHQIDLCQALGVSPAKKYESEGGLGLPELFGLLGSSFIERPVVALDAALRWIVFNYLIGNLDAHAKNIAFLMAGDKAVLAPHYDLLCVEAYLPRAAMWMAIGGENRPGWIEAAHWDAMAADAGVAPRLVRSALRTMVERMAAGVARVIGDPRFTAAELDFLRRRVLPVVAERCTFVAEVLKIRSPSLQDIIKGASKQ